MIKVSYKKKGLTIGHIWFCENQNIQEWVRTQDIVYLHGLRTPHPGGSILNKQYSLLINLKKESGELLSNIKKNYRYEIRRAEKENISIRVLSGKEILESGSLYKNFIDTYNNMYKAKGMKIKFNHKLVEAYMEQNAIVFTIAYSKNEPLVYHSYICDNNQTRFFYSASSFRTDTEQAALIGRMNKYLHWKDILYFKEAGLTEYDWGGITGCESPNGIDTFKMGFGGKRIEYYNQLTAGSGKGKVFLAVKSKWQILTNRKNQQ